MGAGAGHVPGLGLFEGGIRQKVLQGLKPGVFFGAFLARLKSGPYYKAFESGGGDGFCGNAGKRNPGAKQRKKAPVLVQDSRKHPSGAKAQLILLASSALLKPCPFKTEPWDEFFRSL